MPEQPEKKRARPLLGTTGLRAGGDVVPYAELHAKSNFSFLQGASHPDELIQQAAELGYQALAVTDVNSLAGVVRAHVAAGQVELPLVVGAEIRPQDAAAVVLWASDRAAYGRLARLITTGRRRAPKGECHLRLDDVAGHAEGLLAGVVLSNEGEDGDPAERNPVSSRNRVSGLENLGAYRDIFGDRCYALAELHDGPDDERALDRMVRLARTARVPLVAAGDVHYHVKARAALQDVLTAIRSGCTVEEAGPLRFANAMRYLKAPEEMDTAFARAPGAVRRTVEVAGRCRFSLAELRYEYPEELAPRGLEPMDYLTRLAWRGAQRRYPQGVSPKVRRLLEHELRLIRELRYEAYFLTVWDLVRFARSRGILCQGRGSAANSVVCYCLGVTAVDPARIDVLFERFVIRERNEAPDIDVDFEHERREEVLQYLYEKYGRERAGLAAEVITYRPRSAIRDVGKALGLSLDRVDALAKAVDHRHEGLELAQRCREVGIDPEAPLGRRLVWCVEGLLGFPRHLSQHVGGMVITREPLCELVPIENAVMPERTVIQWDKDDLDDLGILKVDCLALGMLTAIRKCFEMVERHAGRRLTLATVPEGDAEVYEMICRADTVGVFQIESRAQMSMLPRLKPRCYYDLVIEVAIVRPGPIQGNMVHPYLRRRAGGEPITYPNEAIRRVLHKTLGVPIFQEQAMRLAVVAAGFTPGEADQLRRAMGAWRRPGIIDKFRRKLIEGMRTSGLSREYAEAVFRQIRGFGEYGFPESHAASFALLAYVSAWLKHHEPAAFTAALANSQPMGFYAPAQLVRDAREHGVEVRPVDVNHSAWDCTLEGVEEPALRLGLRTLVGLAEHDGQAIERAGRERRFGSMDDFRRRTGLSRAVLERLAAADAFGSLGLDRRRALWEALEQEPALPLFAPLETGFLEAEQKPIEEEPDFCELEPMTLEEQVTADYQTSGLSLRAHPLSFLREELDHLRVVPAGRLASLDDGRYLRVAGLVLLRQRPSTARGITFVTLEDETGQANLVIRPDVWNRFRPIARGASALIVSGRLERKEGVIHVLAARLEDLTDRLQTVRHRSRDFR